MQPRNPRSETCHPHWPFVAGAGNPQQLQAWIAGPNAAGDALVIVSNLGPDEGEGRGKGGTFRTKCTGSHKLSISLAELGLAADARYETSVVWDGRAAAGKAAAVEKAAAGKAAVALRVHVAELGGAGDLPGTGKSTAGEVSEELGPWESVMYILTRAGTS